MILFLSIAALMATSLLAGLICRKTPRMSAWILAFPAAAVFTLLFSQLGSLSTDNAISAAVSWIPELGVDLAFRLDGLSLIFALLITGVGALIAIYSGGYFGGSATVRGRFYAYLFMFMASMLGLVTADDIILLFVFWELTSVSSYLLIGYKHESKLARNKALQALLVTGFGGMALLAGLILLSIAAGTSRLSEIIAMGAELSSHPLAVIALPLILLGAFTKSAQFPFHFWLPNAMAAPTPVSAYLHSATMVKAGVFLLLKFYPVFGTTFTWEFSLTLAGAITLMIGTISGLFQHDLKRILAFTTMAVLGMLVMLIGIGGELALKSAILFLIGHALYKATLFMTAGNIDTATGTRDVRVLGGLRRLMPITALVAGLAALSKGGFPPLMGFIGKEYVYKTSSSLEMAAPWITGIALVGNILLLALAFKAGIHPFWAKPPSPSPSKSHSCLLPKAPEEVSIKMIFGPAVLAVLGLLIGLFPHSWSDIMVGPALTAAVGSPTNLSIDLWHGISIPLVLSILTVAGGITIYALRQWFWKRHGMAKEIADRDTERVYHFTFNRFVEWSKAITKGIQQGSLTIYLWVIFSAAGLLVGYKLISLGVPGAEFSLENLNVMHIAISVAMLIAVGFTAFSDSPIKALAGLGLTGYGIALIFALNGAPDLAITQVVVETLTVALLLFATLKLPGFIKRSPMRNKITDTIFASAVGCVVFFLAVKATNIQLAPAISNQLADWSYALAYGKNIVNVILVDFRAIDTFGEIIVLGVAALGVSICLGSLSRKSQYLPSPNSLLRSTVFVAGSKLLLPICLTIAAIALYRGHNEPGGGFIGALVAASGFAIYAFARGTGAAQRLLRLSPLKWIAIGLLVALSSAMIGPLAGLPFMAGVWLPTFELPLLGSIHLGTPILFDIGVFLVVVGFTLQTLFSFLDSFLSTPAMLKNAMEGSNKPQPLTCSK